MGVTWEEINQWKVEQFIDTFGTIYEHSPWVAELVWEKKPFSSWEQLHTATSSIVASADEERQLKLLRNHPDLGARLELTDHSQHEQQRAGIAAMHEAGLEELRQLNREYTGKFGFPFIMAVRHSTADLILNELKRRIQLDREQEFKAALQEVYKIAGFRLQDWNAEQLLTEQG
ncbi:2-oxo-4-hydroxy-4-carboxy-5-ureidoimidazoline decarboxylase [Paenibacillus sp. JX-17]|uniref:2-oxo-4-hydroxy-4-carboxy-5-ureidoimidazoline decarboxylase n=2 Tax=Paenibacillus lacisoli TaxID=3064525 RepID=A0ABT9C8L3_9BACL|nr:2-oxo-4-hydroxy-4-carboxy-5-ureidoimidazoline decarboxylase [Paenibacillus sp. JX-17]